MQVTWWFFASDGSENILKPQEFGTAPSGFEIPGSVTDKHMYSLYISCLCNKVFSTCYSRSRFTCIIIIANVGKSISRSLDIHMSAHDKWR